jgi:5-methylcytosine-specific restriction endonuclease McrA
VRRVYVVTPSLVSRLELFRRQDATATIEETRARWKRFRASAKSREVVKVLEAAAGVRARCFYCSDSRAADIDHFVPISIRIDSAFRWKNFVWVCTACNRSKGGRFPVDGDDLALLINPTIEDPWAHLIIDPDTGVLAPRFTKGEFDAKGEVTLDILSPVNNEPTIEGRLRTIRRLREAIRRVPESQAPFYDELRNLCREVREDDYGVAAWFALWEGSREPVVSELRDRNKVAWQKFVRTSQTIRYGIN